MPQKSSFFSRPMAIRSSALKISSESISSECQTKHHEMHQSASWDAAWYLKCPFKKMVGFQLDDAPISSHGKWLENHYVHPLEKDWVFLGRQECKKGDFVAYFSIFWSGDEFMGFWRLVSKKGCKHKHTRKFRTMGGGSFHWLPAITRNLWSFWIFCTCKNLTVLSSQRSSVK